MESEDSVTLRLEELLKELGKKQRFEEAVSTILSLLRDRYPTASPSLRKSFYSVICRVATVLKTRFTAPGFWLVGLKLFQFSLTLLSDHSERQHLQACVTQAKEILHQIENPSPPPLTTSSNRGYLFEGHLTVDPEPPQPQWLVQSNLLTAAAATLFNAESSQGPAENNNTSENANDILQALFENLDNSVDGFMDLGTVSGPRKVPPASKEVIAKLPVITITEEVLAKLGRDVQCAICRENLAVDDKMQELPCKHTFHPPCLKPWMDEHNSCPICRHELPTDDHKYESWKEREKEAEEERKGAANAKRRNSIHNMETSVASAAGATILSSSSAVFGRQRRWILLSNKTKRRKYTLKRGIEDRFPLFTEYSERTATLVSRTSPASVKNIVSNGYAGRGSSSYGYGGTNSNINKIYKRLESCLVIPPPRGKPPRAIIKFLGGAFIGAIPEVTYSYLIELLAKEGFLIISVPYNVTFDHADATRQVFERFHDCLDSILASGLPDEHLSADQLLNLPLFSVGHSNGALLQVLTGSYFDEKIPKANAIISFNNRPATEAVPYFEQLGPLTSQMMPVVQASPVYSVARSVSEDAWKMLLDAAGAIVPDRDQEVLNSLTKFVDQLPSVVNQMTEGVSEFRPTPSENRDCFKCSYNVQHTLLVKFSSDAIDETDLLEQTLKPRVKSINGTLEKVELSGNHITPCVQEPKWEVGSLYTPADAVAQAFKSLSVKETRELAKTLCNWFERFEA